MIDQTLRDMFVLSIPWIEKIIRPILVYFVLVVGLRLAGKRELGQLNPFDLVVLLTLSNTVQNAIIGDDNTVTGGIIGAASLLFANYFLVRLTYSNKKIEDAVEGAPDALIDRGQLNTPKLKEEMITLQELEAAAQKQGIPSLDEVERAVLAPNGNITFVAKKPPPENIRHQELIARLDVLSREVSALRATRAAGGAGM